MLAYSTNGEWQKKFPGRQPGWRINGMEDKTEIPIRRQEMPAALKFMMWIWKTADL